MEIPLETLVAKGGPWVLLSLCMLYIILGKLIPRSIHDDVRAQRDTWQATATEALKQNTVLLEAARTSSETFKALREVAGDKS